VVFMDFEWHDSSKQWINQVSCFGYSLLSVHKMDHIKVQTERLEEVLYLENGGSDFLQVVRVCLTDTLSPKH
jgi:hypothetical protein